MPTVSIIVPVYNVEPYIHRCIDSILAQTFIDFELILVDDGSPDKCGAICDEYAAKDGRIHVIHQKNQGQAAARNNALKTASGEWILFADSDDMLHPQTLELLYHAVAKHHADIGACQYVEATEVPKDFFNAYAEVSNPLDINEGTIEALFQDGKYYWTVWGKLIRRSVVGEDPFTAGRVYEDNAVACKWLCQANLVAEVPLPLYFYQINSQGTTKSAVSQKYIDFLWALEEQMKLYDEIGYPLMFNRIFGLYIVSVDDRYQKTLQMADVRRARKRIRREAWLVWRKYREKAEEADILFRALLTLSLPHMYSAYHKLLR